MNIYYIPQYSGSVYLGLSDTNNGRIKENTVAVDTVGLVNLLSLHAGLIYPEEKKGKRLIAYCKAIKSAVDDPANQNNIFKSSFEIDPLNTAKQCLEWRDMLRLASWNKDTDIPASLVRLNSLRQIELKIEDDFPIGLADKVENLKNIFVNSNNPKNLIPEKVKLLLPCNIELLHPIIRDLLETISSKVNSQTLFEIYNNAEVKLRTDLSRENTPNVIANALCAGSIEDGKKLLKDGREQIKKWTEGFKIIRFKDKKKATQYMTYVDQKEKVSINSTNSELAYEILGSPKPRVELKKAQGLCQVRQLLIAGLNLFFSPVNLHILMEWLSLPVHPLNEAFRKALRSAIGKTNSLYNKECLDVVKAYVNGSLFLKDGETAIPLKIAKKADLTAFIPNLRISGTDVSFSTVATTSVSKHELDIFLTRLKRWTRRTIGSTLRGEAVDNELSAVQDDIDQLIEILDYDTRTELSYEDLTNLIQLIYEYPIQSLSMAETDSKRFVNRPELLCVDSTSTVWCDFYNAPVVNTTYDFLTRSELQEATSMGLKIWSKEKEMEMYNHFNLIAFIKSKKLVLIICEKDGPTKFQDHPLLALLNNLGIVDQVDGDKLLENKISQIKFKLPISNTLDPESEPYYLVSPSTISSIWPEKDSATSIDDLINNPKKYCMERLAGLWSNDFEKLSPEYTLKGNVAHRVLEILFKNQIDMTPLFNQADTEAVFEKVVDEMALAFRTAKNTISLGQFKADVVKSVERLVDIIQKNGLKIGGCEEKIDNVRFNSANDVVLLDDTQKDCNTQTDTGFTLTGSIDLWLYKGSKGPEGEYYIFDYKWTSQPEKYTEKLIKNMSIQLCLYGKALSVMKGIDHVSTSYYILSKSQLYTCDRSIDNAIILDCIEERKNCDLLTEIINSYAYRKDELQSGLIEDAASCSNGCANYDRDSETRQLVPLDYTGKGDIKRVANKYDDYGVFTTKRND